MPGRDARGSQSFPAGVQDPEVQRIEAGDLIGGDCKSVGIEDLLEASPSLRREIDAVAKRQSAAAAKLASHDLEDHGEPADAVWARREKGGFTIEQILGDWFPEASG